MRTPRGIDMHERVCTFGDLRLCKLSHDSILGQPRSCVYVLIVVLRWLHENAGEGIYYQRIQVRAEPHGPI